MVNHLGWREGGSSGQMWVRGLDAVLYSIYLYIKDAFQSVTFDSWLSADSWWEYVQICLVCQKRTTRNKGHSQYKQEISLRALALWSANNLPVLVNTIRCVSLWDIGADIWVCWVFPLERTLCTGKMLTAVVCRRRHGLLFDKFLHVPSASINITLPDGSKHLLGAKLFDWLANLFYVCTCSDVKRQLF